VGLEGGKPVALGGDQVVERGQAGGDAVLLGGIFVREGDHLLSKRREVSLVALLFDGVCLKRVKQKVVSHLLFRF
jgi:hypothetical protein